MLRLLFGSAASAGCVRPLSQTFPVMNGHLASVNSGTYFDAPDQENKLRNALKCDFGFLPKENLKLKLQMLETANSETIWNVEKDGIFIKLDKNQEDLCVPARLVWYHDAGMAVCRPESEKHHVAFCRHNGTKLVQHPSANDYETFTFADTESARTGHAKGENWKATLCTAPMFKEKKRGSFKSSAHIWTSTKCDSETTAESDVEVQDEVLDEETDFKQVKYNVASSLLRNQESEDAADSSPQRRLSELVDYSQDQSCFHVKNRQYADCIIESETRRSNDKMTFKKAEEWCTKEGGRLPTTPAEADDGSWINASCTGTCHGKNGDRIPYGTEALCENGKPTGYQCRFGIEDGKRLTVWKKKTSRGPIFSRYFNRKLDSTQTSCDLL